MTKLMKKDLAQEFDISHLGQVFTPQNVINDMLELVKSTQKVENPRFLEPSCGEGAFLKHLPANTIGIECDKVLFEKSLSDTNAFCKLIL